MEDTIRDMMMVRAMSNQRHDSSGSGIMQDDDNNDVSCFSLLLGFLFFSQTSFEVRFY